MNTTTNIDIRLKRRPIVTIVIIANNDLQELENCINSLLEIRSSKKNFEFVIINNYENDEQSAIIKSLFNRRANYQFAFYQAPHKTNSAQLRNIGINMARGTWLFFMDAHEKITLKFANFLSTFKFNMQIDFYRLPLLSLRGKRKRIGFFKNKYYSDSSSSIILNSEFIEKYDIRWDAHANFGSTLLLLNTIYGIRNVNYIYLKKMYSVFHDYYYDKIETGNISFEDVKESFNILLKNKKFDYKQFIIVLFNDYLNNISYQKEKINNIRSEIKLMLKQARITYFSYLKLPWTLFWKTIKLRWI